MPLPRFGLAYCPKCGQPVRRMITRAGRLQLMEPEPDDTGNVVAYLDGTQTWRARSNLAEHPQQPWEKRFLPHAATCTAAPRDLSQHRLPDGVTSLRDHRRRRATRPTP